MKNNKAFFLLLLMSVLFLPGCDIIFGIFKAGFWTAIFLIVLIVALGVYAFKKFQDR